MDNLTEKTQISKKRKTSDLFTEFKGLGSLENKEEIKDEYNQKKRKLNSNEEKTSEISHPPRKYFYLLENIDASITKEDIEKYLKEGGVECSQTCLVPGPLAVTFFNREKDIDRLFNICQGLYYKSNELLIIRSSYKAPSNVSDTTNTSDVSVHIKNLSETITENDIYALLDDPSNVQNITINVEKHTAIIDFLDSKSASECISKLDHLKLGDHTLQASFLVKTQRPEQFALKVTNLPHGFNKIDIHEAFPTASRVKILKGNNRYCMIHFKNIDDFKAVIENSNDVLVKGVVVKVEQIVKSSNKKIEKKDNFVLNIYNMPFDTTLAEIKQMYPTVRFIEMLKNPDGMFGGSAKLNFDEKEVCEEALKSTKGLTLRHRKIRAEMKVEHSGPKESEIVDE